MNSPALEHIVYTPGAASGPRSPSRTLAIRDIRRSFASFLNSSAVFGGSSMLADPQEDVSVFARLIPNFVSKHVRLYTEAIARTAEREWKAQLNLDILASASETSSPHRMETMISLLKPVAVEGCAVVAMCDVSGYSSLTSYLANRGPDGAEILSQIMKEYLDKVISVISINGGDIVKFVGDAVIFYWKYDESSASYIAQLESKLRAEQPQWDSKKIKARVESLLMQRKGVVVLQAVRCCLNILEATKNYKAHIPPRRTENGVEEGLAEVRELKLHFGLGAGKIYDIHVGGDPGRWEHLVVGDAMEQVAQILDQAQPGQLALSKKAFEKFKECVDLNKVKPNIHVDGKEYIITSMSADAAIVVDVRHDDDFMALWDIEHAERPPAEITEYYKQYINQSALFKMENDLKSASPFQMNQGVDHLMSLNELRQVTTVFIKIGSLSFQKADNFKTAAKAQKRLMEEEKDELKILHQQLNDISKNEKNDDKNLQLIIQRLESSILTTTTKINTMIALYETIQEKFRLAMHNAVQMSQTALTTVQIILKKHEGILRQFHVDDKGAVILALFGLPPLAHKNDAKLGVQAGLELSKELRKDFDSFSIGITTGVISIGGVGNSLRTEYALMGESINIAARLMAGKEAKNSIISDERTYTLSTSDFDYEELGQVVVKGKSLPISIFRPLQAKDRPKALTRGDFNMIGRLKEREAALQVIERHSKCGASGCIVIVEGEGGQGITMFGHYMEYLASKNDYAICTGSASELMCNTPYYAYRTIVRELISIVDNCDVLEDGSVRVKEIKAAQDSLSTGRAPPTVILYNASNFSLQQPLHSTDFISTTRSTFTGSSSILRNPHLILRSQSQISPPKPLMETVKDHCSDFERMVRRCLLKTGGISQLSYLFTLVLPTEFRSDELKHWEPSQDRHDELVNSLAVLFNAIALMNRVMVHISEVSFMDPLSWQLTRSLMERCPRVLFVLLSRPQKYYTLADQEMYSNVRAKATVLELVGLSLEDTRDLIVSSWNASAKCESDPTLISSLRQQTISSVSPAIAQRVYTISSGNPLFVHSLVTMLKDSKMYEVATTRMLTLTGEFDFGDIAPGSDLHSIIVSQFDRLDRSFQAFLKMCSVMGEKFLLDEALAFVRYESAEGAGSLKAPMESGEAMIAAVEQQDKFTFMSISRPLTTSSDVLAEKESSSADTSNGVMLSFKNSIIRKSINSTMLTTQRQALHLSMARFYETQIKANDANPQLVLKIFDHYQRIEGQIGPKLKYLSQLCRYYFQINAMQETARYYENLLTLYEVYERQMAAVNPQSTHILHFSDDEKAIWYMEMGEAYSSLSLYEKAEGSLRKSLTLLKSSLPYPGFILKLHAYKERWLFKRLIHKTTDTPNTLVQQQERLNLIRTVLLSLAKLFDETDRIDLWAYVLWLGMNISYGLPRNSRYATYLAASAYALYVTKSDPVLAIYCIERAENLIAKCDYLEANDDINISMYHTILLLLSGDLTGARGHCLRALSNIENGTIVSGLHQLEKCGRLLMFIEFFSGHHKDCKIIANKIWVRSKERSWRGRFWSLAFIFLLDINLLDISQKTRDRSFTIYLIDLRKRSHTLLDEQTRGYQQLHIHLINSALELETEFWLRADIKPELDCHLKQMTVCIKHATAFHWPILIALCSTLNLIFIAHDSVAVDAFGPISIVTTYLTEMMACLRRMNHIVYSSHILELARGLLFLLYGRAKEAVRVWKGEVERIRKSTVAQDCWTAQVLVAKVARYSEMTLPKT